MISDELVAPLAHPSSWQLATLKSITTKIGSGATPTGGQATYQATRENFAFVRSQNVFDRAFSEGGLAFISDEQAGFLKSAALQPDDLLLNITGDGVTFARACRVPRSILPACVNQHVSIIRVDRSKVDPGYVLSYLTCPEIKPYIESFNAGGSRRAITKAHIESFVISIPPLNVQRQIAELLDGLDDRISLLRETNATLEAIALALFKSWFVDFDPVRARVEGRAPEGMDEATAALFPDVFEESELGLVPKGWTVGSLGDVAVTVKQQLRAAELHAGLRYVGLEHIPRKSLSLNDWGSADGLESDKTAFEEGDILFGKLRPYFHKVVVAPFDGVCSTDILVLQSKVPSYFGIATMHLFSTALIDYADRLSNGAKMPRVSWKDLSAYPIVVPPAHVAGEFTSVIGHVLDSMTSNVNEAQTLAMVRDTLLPRLISGQLRLPESVHSMEVSNGI